MATGCSFHVNCGREEDGKFLIPAPPSSQWLEARLVSGGPPVCGFASMGAMSSDAGALLLGKADRAIGLVTRFAAIDVRASELSEHSLETLVGQRLFGLAFGYEDLNDHDHLRHDPVMAVLAGKLEARRKSCAPVAGKSTLNRLEQACEERVPAYGSDRALFGVRTSGRRSSGAGPSQTKSTGTAPTGSACSTWSSPVPLTRRLR
jgi:Transposase DDE domain group 1